jgi:hypothetical protein
MTQDKARKAAIRARMAAASEPYSVARHVILSDDPAGAERGETGAAAGPQPAAAPAEDYFDRYLREAREAGVPDDELDAMAAAHQAGQQVRAAREAADRAEEVAGHAEEAAELAQERAAMAEEAAALAAEWAGPEEQAVVWRGAEKVHDEADRARERADRAREAADEAAERAEQAQEWADEADDFADDAPPGAHVHVTPLSGWYDGRSQPWMPRPPHPPQPPYARGRAFWDPSGRLTGRLREVGQQVAKMQEAATFLGWLGFDRDSD